MENTVTRLKNTLLEAVSILDAMEIDEPTKKLEWYANPKNYGKAVKVKTDIDDIHFIRQLNAETTKDWNYYEPLEESDWKMV